MRKYNIKPIIISIFTVILPLLFQLAYVRYVSYQVDKNIYGDFVILITLISALSQIFLTIISGSFTRFFNTALNKTFFINEFRTLLIFINILSIFVFILYGVILQKYTFDILLILFVYFVIFNYFSFNKEISLLNLERKKYFILKIVESCAKFITPVVFYAFFQNLKSLLIGLVFGYLVSFLVLYSYLKAYPFKYTFRIANVKKYFAYASPIVLVSLFSWGISFADRYFIDFYMSSKDVAIYAILAQVAGMGQILGQIFSLYVNPKVLKMYESNPKYALKYLSKSLWFMLFSFILMGIVAYTLPINIYKILIEPEIIENRYYYYTFMILIIGIFATVFQTSSSMYLILYKKLNILAFVFCMAFVVNIIGNLFIKQYGIIAAGISTLLAYLTINILMYIYLGINRKGIIN